MKKILLAILSLITIACYSQTTGHLRYDSVRMYRMGGNSELLLENATRDSLGFLYNYGNGRTRFEVIREVPGGIKVGGDTINVTSTSGMRRISGGDIVYSGTGNTFNIQAAVYEIGGVIYSSPAGQFTLAASDPTLNRQDVVYLGTDNNFHVLQGTAAIPAAVPQVDGDQLALTSISIPAGSTTPGITTTVIYNENIEGWVWSASATTIDPNNTTNVWIGAISANVTNIVHAGYVELTKTFGSFDVATVDALALFIKLKMQVPTLSEIWISLWNGTAQLTTEIKVSFNKNNITTYQGVSIPIPAFGVPSSTIINKIRFRWRITGPTNPNYTGWYFDYLHFVDNLAPPGTGGNINFSMPSPAFLVTGSPGTNIGVTMPGSVTDYLRANGTTAPFPTLLNTVGTLDGRSKVADGLVIDTDSLFAQTVDYTYPGLATPAMKMKWDSAYFIQNLGNGDTLAMPVNDSTTGIKSFRVTGSGGSAFHTDSTFGVNITGGAGITGVPNRVPFFDGTSTLTSDTALRYINDIFGGTLHVGNSGAGDSGNGAYGAISGITDIYFLNNNGNLLNQDSTDWSIQSAFSGTHVDLSIGSLTLDGGSRFENMTFFRNKTQRFHGITNYNGNFGSLFTDSTLVDKQYVDSVVTAGGGSGANTALSNLASVAINTSLISDADNTDDLGSTSISWKDIYSRSLKFDGATSGTITVNSDALGNTLNGTNLSGDGFIGITQVFIERSDVTLANVTTDQPIYASSHDLITVQPNTTYHFKGRLHMTHNATAHSISMGMIPTTATVTSINYFTIATVSAVNVQGPAQTTTYITQTASTAINASGSNATESVVFEGEITIGATGGTITPVIKFSADPTGTILVKAGAILYWTAIGNDTFTTQGNAN